MDRIHWFAVSNSEQKRFPEWRRSFGIGDNGIVFWNKGNDAQVEWPAGTNFNCATDGKTVGE